MDVAVDKTWHDSLAAEIERRFVCAVWLGVSNSRYAIVGDMNGGALPHPARAIDQACVAKNHLVSYRP
jgi:hypothetical protein